MHAVWQTCRSLLLVLTITCAVLPVSSVVALDREIPAITPAPQVGDWWVSRHEAALTRVREGAVDLVLIGDSIMQGWNGQGQRVWAQYYERRRALNLGFSSDRTEHVLWRLQHGEIDGIHPKVAVVMIGTNNTGSRKDAPEDTAAGVQAIVTLLRTKLPDTKILLLGIFPRGATATDALRRVNAAINDRLREMADGRDVVYQDLGRVFVDAEGRLDDRLMPDLLHPNEAGYRVWAEGMEPHLKALMGE